MTELEKAAEEYAKKYPSDTYKTDKCTVIPSYTARNSFIAGSEWQAKQSPWISVADELPPMAEHVVLKKGAFYVGFGFFGENMVFHSTAIGDNSLAPKTVAFTHWMPIPELSKE